MVDIKYLTILYNTKGKEVNRIKNDNPHMSRDECNEYIMNRKVPFGEVFLSRTYRVLIFTCLDGSKVSSLGGQYGQDFFFKKCPLPPLPCGPIKELEALLLEKGIDECGVVFCEDKGKEYIIKAKRLPNLLK